MSRKFVGVAVGATLFSLIAACGSGSGSGSGEGSADPGSDAAGDGPYTIGVSIDYSIEFRQAEIDAVNAAAEARGWETIVVNADEDAQRQSQQIQDLIDTRNVDALIVVPWNRDQISSSIALANARDIPIVFIDKAPADMENIDFFIGSNPFADGEIAGQFLVETGEELDVLHLMGSLTDANAIGRRDGFNEIVEASSNVNVVAEVPTEWDQSKTLDGTTNALMANPQINAIYVHADSIFTPVLSAIEAAGRQASDFVIVSIDGDALACAAVQDGRLAADIATDINQIAEQGVRAVEQALTGETIEPNAVYLDGLLLTPENFDEVSPEIWGCN